MKTIPDICHLWYATALSKAVKSTRERTPIHDQNCLATKQHTGVFDVLGTVGIGIVYLLQSIFGIYMFAVFAAKKSKWILFIQTLNKLYSKKNACLKKVCYHW